MGILKHIICAAVGLSLCGCYTDFTPNTDTEPVLCLNCIVTAGEPIEPTVTHTWLYDDANGAQNNGVDDAVITLFANGEQVGADYIPRHGDRIRIHASSERYGDAEGEVVVPDPVPMGEVKLTPRVTYRDVWSYDSTETVLITFDMSVSVAVPDPEDRENFYHYSLFGYADGVDFAEDATGPIYNGGITAGGMDVEYEPIFSEHISTIESIMGSVPYGFTFFTDRQFNGKTYTLNLKYEHCEAVFRVESGQWDELPDCGFAVRLSAISPSYYTWYNYCWQVYDGILGELESVGLGDPIWGYSNVSTNAGVIVARSKSECRIDLRDFIKKTIDEFRAEQGS